MTFECYITAIYMNGYHIMGHCVIYVKYHDNLNYLWMLVECMVVVCVLVIVHILVMLEGNLAVLVGDQEDPKLLGEGSMFLLEV